MRLDGDETAPVPNETRRSFWAVYQDFRRCFDLEELDIDPDEVFAGVRDPSPGKDFSW